MIGGARCYVRHKESEDATPPSASAPAGGVRGFSGRAPAVRFVNADAWMTLASAARRAFAVVFTVSATLACGCSSERSAAASGDVADSASHALAREIAKTDALARAQAAIDSGHPWRATQALAPVLADANKRTPAALIVAARAAAGWNGWAEVRRLLGRATWLDAQFDGEGRELLARAAFGLGDDTTALIASRAAYQRAKGAQRGVRSVLLARALERNNYFDSATTYYAAAARALPPARDWLLLRAAGTEADSAKRAATYASLSSAAAKARVPWTEAQTRERYGDALGAAAAYESLGATVTALRLRLSVAPDSATRTTIRDALVAFVRTHSGSSDARTAVEVLDRGFTSLSGAEELIVARSTAASGPAARAVSGFARAAQQGLALTARDQLSYGLALSRAGRTSDALARLARVPAPLAGDAAYQRARIYLTSGTGDQTRAALRDVVARFANDTSAASSALYLLADLSTDTGDDDQARNLFQQLYRTYPSSGRVATARFRSAMIALVHDDAAAAAAELDSLSARYAGSDEAIAARYWAGRAYAAAGDKGRAAARWRGAMSDNSVSYYATKAAERLGTTPWVPPARPDSFARFPSLDSAFARVALLDSLGMDTESRFELDAIDDAATTSTEKIAATARAFVEHGQASRAIRLAQKLVNAGLRDARTYRLLFPVVDGPELTRTAKARGLDPALVAGLIRQESSFTPTAVSVANARGLMQVLPSVGDDVARSLGFPVWTPALLFDADANLQLGTAHLAAFVKQYGALPRVLAAYNAGGSRVDRWSAKAGMDDPEIFTERIPFVETRDYVRIVQRNAEMYRALYRWR
jgi:soluble lytic murein transglycosylase